MTAIGFGEWKAMWDKSGPWPVITHADAQLLLGHIAALEDELAESKCGHEMAADESLRRLSEIVDRDRKLTAAHSVIRVYRTVVGLVGKRFPAIFDEFPGWSDEERMAIGRAAGVNQ